MIPKADIVAWRQIAPWVSDAQVEQDLIISRALVSMFQNTSISEQLAFRGGTALHKLYFNPPRRYSEDIDLVQIVPGPIGGLLDTLQEILNVFLGKPRRNQKERSVTLTYRMESEGPPVVPLRLKVEINTREHFTVYGLHKRPFNVHSRWFLGECAITTFELEELLATKVRALYQRRKGRDLFDLWLGLTEGKADAGKVVKIFQEYMKAEGHGITREDYEKNIEAKMKHPGFLDDVKPLLSADMKYDVNAAFSFISEQIVSRI
ncbi:MAG: nucleotidyl transferase AbiEii/AbiGii toxin family protein [Deltaproteobacteria bacterium]|nr:MAG: nucleotidyl transferase AbiEii/AbiGii toxin family protein [Deltaproteobacteria bacterium]